MALTMPPTMDDSMDIDIDINMSIEEPIVEEDILEDGEHLELNTKPDTLIPAIYLEDPSKEPSWEKIHIRGIDDLSTDTLRTFACDYFPDATPYVQWIDDTSANLVYKDKLAARKAFKSFIMHDISDEMLISSPFEMRTAKPIVTNPGSILTVRVAMVGDKKRKGARDASRYYLMHPEEDPGERGDYKRRRFDERELRRRHADDVKGGEEFEASMYDEKPARRARSASPDAGERRYRSRREEPKQRNKGRELFDERTRSESLDLFARVTKPGERNREKGRDGDGDGDGRQRNGDGDREMNGVSYESNQGVARQLRADLKAAQQNGTSPARAHRRSRAIDTRVEEDLVERFGRKSLSLDSTKSVRETTVNSGKELFGERGLNVKGGGQGMSIKGRADVRELFPAKFSSGGRERGNAGKELFDGQRRTRQRAGDLFD